MIVKEVEVSLFDLFMQSKYDCKIRLRDLLHWMNTQLNMEVTRRRPEGVSHVEVCNDPACASLFVRVFERGAVIRYPAAKMNVDNVKTLKESLPSWLFESIEELNGMKLNWAGRYLDG